MGNTVGSTNADNLCNFFTSPEDAYILGLWCADGYWWASSVGLSNVDTELLSRFEKFLLKRFPKERIKFNNHHLYVNSRPLLREFVAAKRNLERLRGKEIINSYLAGRFDGDGSIDKNLRNDCRIVYGRRREAEIDRKLLRKVGIKKTKIYYYRTARTFCLYISRFEAGKFLESIYSYSSKIQKLSAFVSRRDLASGKSGKLHSGNLKPG